MSTFNAYILRLTLKPLLLAILIALLLLLVERMVRVLDLVLGSNGSLNVLVKLMTYLVPHYMGLAIPVAFFLAMVLTFNRLQRESELDAFRSVGIGLHQQLKPLLLLSGVLTILAAVIFAYLQPHAHYTYRSLVYGLTNQPLNKYLQNGLFIKIDGTTYMVEGIDRDHQRFSRVFAYHVGKDGVSTAMTAQSGQLVQNREGGPATLILMDGRRMDVEPDSMMSSKNEERMPSVLSFQETRMAMKLSHEKDFRGRGADERELTLTELWERRNDPPPDATRGDMLGELHDRLVRIASIMILPFLALPLSVGGRRAQRTSGIAFGLAILIVYNELLRASEKMTAVGQISPLISQWLPFVLLAAFSVTLFFRAAFTVSQGSWIDEMLHQIVTTFSNLRRREKRIRA